MARRRFRWTRKNYRLAESLARLMGRHIYELPETPPDLVRRLFDLWDRHPQQDDPLLTPRDLRPRYNEGNEIPF